VLGSFDSKRQLPAGDYQPWLISRTCAGKSMRPSTHWQGLGTQNPKRSPS
jgi:hypothetical protein